MNVVSPDKTKTQPVLEYVKHYKPMYLISKQSQMYSNLDMNEID